MTFKVRVCVEIINYIRVFYIYKKEAKFRFIPISLILRLGATILKIGSDIEE